MLLITGVAVLRIPVSGVAPVGTISLSFALLERQIEEGSLWMLTAELQSLGLLLTGGAWVTLGDLFLPCFLCLIFSPIQWVY